MGEIESIILENLIYNEEYSRKVIPFLKGSYFSSTAYRLVFDQIFDYTTKYNTLPSQAELVVELKNKNGLSQSDFDDSVDIINELTKKNTAPSIDWLVEHSERFCKERALYNALVDAAEKMDEIESTGNFNLGEIPEAIQTALGITFDTSIGLDYEVAEERWERRKQRKVDKVSFFLPSLNDATGGGMNLKTVTCVAGGTGAGKSAVKCAQAAHSISIGEDVLYITMEMDEDSIADRIDANILGIDLDDIPNLSKEDYTKRLKKKMSGKKFGRLIIKEYPTCGAGVLEFRALLNELKLKQKFIPKLIIVDYLNICTSSRYKLSVVNSYTLVKAIAEELRGLAKEFNAAILTGTQLNREGVDNVNVSLKEISESSGLSHTVDMLFAIMRTEELDEQNQIMIKQLKNRFADMAKMLRWCIGVDRAKFRYFDIDGKEIKQPNDVAESPAEEEKWNGNFGVQTNKRRRDFSALT